MVEFFPNKIIKYSPLLLPLLLGACQATLIDAYPILAQKCEADDVAIVDGVPVAGVSFILSNGERVMVGKNGLGGRNLVTIKGNGGLTITTSNSNSPPVILDDGRIEVKNITLRRDTPNDILAISHHSLGDYTMIGVAMNCKDPASLPPLGRNRQGFSPSKRSKESPFAFNGLHFSRKS